MARAWVELYHTNNVLSRLNVDRDGMQKAMDAAQRAVALDPGDAEAHAAYAMALRTQNELDRAKVSFDTALRLAPNAFEILTFYAGNASLFGESERGAAMAERAISLNPDYPIWSAGFFAFAFFRAERYEDTLRTLDRRDPASYNPGLWIIYAIALGALGRDSEAKATVQRALQRFPGLTIEEMVSEYRLYGPKLGSWSEILRIAGLAVCAPAEKRTRLSPEAKLPECEAD